MTTLLDAKVSLNEVIDAMHEALEAVARKATNDDHPYTVARQVTQTVYARLANTAREAQLEREKAAAMADAYAKTARTCPYGVAGCPESPCSVCKSNASSVRAALKEPKTRPDPISTPPVTPETQAWLDARAADDAKLEGVNSVARGEPSAYRAMDGSFQPPARAHLKGCVLDTTHEGACYGPSLLAGLAGLKEPKTRAEPTFGVSPRQALGEALACVERARDLLRTAASAPPESMPFEARHAAFQAFDAVRNAWCSMGSAKALLDIHEASK